MLLFDDRRERLVLVGDDDGEKPQGVIADCLAAMPFAARHKLAVALFQELRLAPLHLRLPFALEHDMERLAIVIMARHETARLQHIDARHELLIGVAREGLLEEGYDLALERVLAVMSVRREKHTGKEQEAEP